MISTGKQPISWMTYLAILSVCLIINLPGVAIAPVEGKLMHTLHTSELEIQLLTTLPNFVIIPFVFLAGRLSFYRHKMVIIIIALILYLGSAVAYLFSNSMEGLIIMSCLLGCADGLLIPFAMGFIVNTFSGKYRTRNLGIKSATSNFGVVGATFIIGFMVDKTDWHLPFSVYLIALLPLALSYWLKYIPGMSAGSPIPAPPSSDSLKDICVKDIDSQKIWGLIFNNVVFTFITFSIVIYTPQLIAQNGWNAEISAYLSSVFFIAVLASGFFLVYYVKTLRSFSYPILGCSLALGLGLITFVHSVWALFVGAVFAGLSFGIFQPLIYDKTSYAIHNPLKNIFGLSLVLTALYIAIAVEPFVITGVCKLFHVADENHFVFILSFFMAIGYIFLSYFLRKRFTFLIEEDYYT